MLLAHEFHEEPALPRNVHAIIYIYVSVTGIPVCLTIMCRDVDNP